MSINAWQSIDRLVDRTGNPTNRFSLMEERALVDLLEDYCKLVAKNGEVEGDQSDRMFTSFRSSSSTKRESPSLLASTIVHNKVYVDDPIARHVADSSHFRIGSQEIDRKSLIADILWLRDMRPLISEGVVVPILMTALHKTNEVPIYYSEDLFRSSLPDRVLRLAALHCVVRPGEYLGGPFVVYDKPLDAVSDCIAISFDGDFSGPGMVWAQTEMSFGEENEVSFNLQVKSPMPHYSMHRFEAWVEQCVNRTILSRLEHISRELAFCDRLRSNYATESSFEYKLLSSGEKEGQLPVANAQNFLLHNSLIPISPEQVIKFRNHNATRLDDFQQSIYATTASLCSADDFMVAARREFDTRIRPQIESVQQAWYTMYSKSLNAVLISGIAAATNYLTNTAIPMSAVLPLAVAGAAAVSLPHVSEYHAKKKGIAFLWYQLHSK